MYAQGVDRGFLLYLSNLICFTVPVLGYLPLVCKYAVSALTPLVYLFNLQYLNGGEGALVNGGPTIGGMQSVRILLRVCKVCAISRSRFSIVFITNALFY